MIRLRVPGGEARYERGEWTVKALPGLASVIRSFLEVSTEAALYHYRPERGDPEGVVAVYLEREAGDVVLDLSYKLEPLPEKAVA